MGTSLPRLLRLAAAVLFILGGIGFATLSIGTVTLSLVSFGLACWVLSEL